MSLEHYADYYGDPGLAAWRELGGRDKARNIIAIWPRPTRPAKIADIGCGDGAVLAHLAREGFGESYTGFEVSHSAIAAAEKRAFGCSARFALFDGSRLPAGDREYDLAILSHVLEHVDDPRGLLRETARIAEVVYIEVPAALHSRTPHDFVWTKTGHINLFNALLLRQLAQSCGLRVLGERTLQPSRELVSFHSRSVIGTARWAAKRVALALRFGPKVATYHCCLVAEHQ